MRIHLWVYGIKIGLFEPHGPVLQNGVTAIVSNGTCTDYNFGIDLADGILGHLDHLIQS